MLLVRVALLQKWHKFFILELKLATDFVKVFKKFIFTKIYNNSSSIDCFILKSCSIRFQMRSLNFHFILSKESKIKYNF